MIKLTFDGSKSFLEELDKFKMNIKKFALEKQLDEQYFLDHFFSIDRFEGFDARYVNTPTEFFPFASSGCEGTHYGTIYHYSDEESPLYGMFCPLDENVVIIGRSFKEAIENLISSKTGNGIYDNEDIDTLREFCRRFAFEFREEETEIMYKSNEVPSNRHLRFLPTSDGIGIYAPSAMFSEDSHVIKDPYNGSQIFSQSQIYSEKGYHATALFYLKELILFNWTEDELLEKALFSMAFEYEMLGKKHLKEVALSMLEIELK